MDAAAAGGLDERFFMYQDVTSARGSSVRPENSLHAGRRVVHLRGRSAASAPPHARPLSPQPDSLLRKNITPRWVPLLKLYVRISRRWPTFTRGAEPCLPACGRRSGRRHRVRCGKSVGGLPLTAALRAQPAPPPDRSSLVAVKVGLALSRCSPAVAGSPAALPPSRLGDAACVTTAAPHRNP
jgi:hypothetical protein